MKASIAFSLLFLAVVLPCLAAPFINLGFDVADTNNLSDAVGSTTDLLPGWNLSRQGNPFGALGLNWTPEGIGPFATLFDQSSGHSVEDRFSLCLSGGFDVILGMEFFPWSITQVGTIPSDAKTLRFLTYARPLELRVNDILIPLEFDYSRFPSTDPIMRAGDAFGDISAFAGQTVELKFTTPRNSLHGIDSISFSPEKIPEPGSLALVALGGIGMFLRLRFCCTGVRKISVSSPRTR